METTYLFAPTTKVAWYSDDYKKWIIGKVKKVIIDIEENSKGVEYYLLVDEAIKSNRYHIIKEAEIHSIDRDNLFAIDKSIHTLEDVLAANDGADDMLEKITNMEVGETTYFGMSMEVTRLS